MWWGYWEWREWRGKDSEAWKVWWMEESVREGEWKDRRAEAEWGCWRRERNGGRNCGMMNDGRNERMWVVREKRYGVKSGIQALCCRVEHVLRKESEIQTVEKGVYWETEVDVTVSFVEEELREEVLERNVWGALLNWGCEVNQNWNRERQHLEKHFESGGRWSESSIVGEEEEREVDCQSASCV